MVRRYECLQFLAGVIDDALVIIWAPGGHGKEWWHLQQNPSLFTSLGYATPIGLGLALNLPHRRVVVIDTDGGILLNPGVLCTIGTFRPPNLKVFVIDNECYESIGGMPTATAERTDLAAIARGAGIEHAETTRTLEELKDVAKRALAERGAYFTVVKVEKGSEKLPPEPTDGIERKYQFVRYIEQTEKVQIIAPPLQHAGAFADVTKGKGPKISN